MITNMKKTLFIAAAALLSATLLFCTSCGDDEDNKINVGNENRPAWTTRDNLYQEMELTMAVQVTLPEALLPHASDDDLMCATIDGEVRAVSGLQRTANEVYFPLVVAGNSGSGMVSINYYSSQLKRIFTFQNWMPFTPSIQPTDSDGKPYVVDFTTN